MKNDRGIEFQVGDTVKFQYAIPVQKNEDIFEFDKIDIGVIQKIDGEDVYIKTDICECHRYKNEILINVSQSSVTA